MKPEKEKVWVWFKGGLDGGYWMGGFLATKEEGECEEVLIERSDFVKCRVPRWRISQSEPKDNKIGPYIPDNAEWKYY